MPYLSDAWTASVATREKKFSLLECTVHDYLASILKRIRYIITTRDILESLKLESYKTFGGKPYGFRYFSSYYFGYMLVLCTALIDSIGCVICFSVNKKIRSGHEVSIRKKLKNKFNSVIELIQKNNKELADYISSDSIQSFFELLYFLRNFIAHSSLPDPIHYSGNIRGLSGHLISLKGDILDKIYEFCNYNQVDQNLLLQIGFEHKKNTFDEAHHEKLLEPILFSRFLVERLTEFVNMVFRLMSLQEKLISTKGEEIEFSRLKRKPLFEKGDLMDQVTEALTLIEASVP